MLECLVDSSHFENFATLSAQSQIFIIFGTCQRPPEFKGGGCAVGTWNYNMVICKQISLKNKKNKKKEEKKKKKKLITRIIAVYVFFMFYIQVP